MYSQIKQLTAVAWYRETEHIVCVCVETNEYEIRNEANEMKSSRLLQNMLDSRAPVHHAYEFHTFLPYLCVCVCACNCGCFCVFVSFYCYSNSKSSLWIVVISKEILNWLCLSLLFHSSLFAIRRTQTKRQCCKHSHTLTPHSHKLVSQWASKRAAITMPIRDKVSQKKTENKRNKMI